MHADEIILAIQQLPSDEREEVFRWVRDTGQVKERRWDQLSQEERDEAIRNLKDLRQKLAPKVRGILKPGETWKDLAREGLA